jgi:hypothetical protein
LSRLHGLVPPIGFTDWHRASCSFAAVSKKTLTPTYHTITSPLTHNYPTITSPLPNYHTIILALHYRYHAITLSLPYNYPPITPILLYYLTITLQLPHHYPTIAQPPPYHYFTCTLPLPYKYSPFKNTTMTLQLPYHYPLLARNGHTGRGRISLRFRPGSLCRRRFHTSRHLRTLRHLQLPRKPVARPLTEGPLPLRLRCGRQLSA